MSFTITPKNFDQLYDIYEFLSKHAPEYEFNESIDWFDLLTYEKDDDDREFNKINLKQFKQFINHFDDDDKVQFINLIRSIVILAPENKTGAKIIDILLDLQDIVVMFDYDEIESFSEYLKWLFTFNNKLFIKFANGIIKFMQIFRNNNFILQGFDERDIFGHFMEYIVENNKELFKYIVDNIENPEFFMNGYTMDKYFQKKVVDSALGMRQLKLPDLVIENIISNAYDTTGLDAYKMMDTINGIMHHSATQTRAARFPSYKDA